MSEETKERIAGWMEAESHLKEIRMRYTEIGRAGMLALRMSIDPLLVRFENGERTDELHAAMMALE